MPGQIFRRVVGTRWEWGHEGYRCDDVAGGWPAEFPWDCGSSNEGITHQMTQWGWNFDPLSHN